MAKWLPQEPNESPREFLAGSGPTRTLGGLSLAVFTVTGVLWIAKETAHWPDGYLPWLLVLGAVLFAIASFLRFREMQLQRNEAIRELGRRFDRLRYRFELSEIRMDWSLNPGGAEHRACRLVTLLRNSSSEPLEYEVVRVIYWLGMMTADSDQHPVKVIHIAQPEVPTSLFWPWITKATREEVCAAFMCQLEVLYRHPSGGPQFRLKTKFEVQPANFGDDGWPTSWIWIYQSGPTHDEASIGS